MAVSMLVRIILGLFVVVVMAGGVIWVIKEKLNDVPEAMTGFECKNLLEGSCTVKGVNFCLPGYHDVKSDCEEGSLCCVKDS